jgi:hypothetical protein
MLAVLLTVVVRGSPVFTEKLYLPFSRIVSGWLGVLFSFSSYAAAEALCVIAVIAFTALLVRSVIRSAREKTAWPAVIWVSGVILFISLIFFLFALLWGGTYYKERLEVKLGLQIEQVDEEILYRTALMHLGDVIRYAALVPRGAEGEADAGGFEALAPEAARALKSLMLENPDVFGKAPVTPPKRSAFYPVMSMFGVAGIYSPFTGEAIVNTVGTDPFMPSVMAHELAHRLGFAAEDEANFIAYLVCMASDRPIFRYSGALLAYSYCYNALTNRQYRSALWSVLTEEAPEVIEDLRRDREKWDEYESPLREVGSAVNNAYLQSMGQEDGIRSYGRVADILIALYLSERK